MSKGKKNNKNNNKALKIPVKSQPMKQQKPAPIKAEQVVNKNGPKPLIKPIAKVEVNKKPVFEKKELKAPKKEVDIAESDEDEDESDDDIDDVILGESDDDNDDDVNDNNDSSDDDDDDSEDDDLSFENVDNSDLESIELDDEDSDEDSENVVMKVNTKKPEVKPVGNKEAAKAIEKAVKPVKKESKFEVKKEISKFIEKIKAEEKKVTPTSIEKKDANIEEKKEVSKSTEGKVINPLTKEGKILAELNKRKSFFNDCAVFVSNLHATVTRQGLTDLLSEKKIPVVNINLPGKIKGKILKIRGYCFIRLANSEDAKKTIALLNGLDFLGTKLKASPFVAKKIYDDISKVNFCKIIVQSFKDEDITDNLKKHFKEPVKVIKHLNTQYCLEFFNKEDAVSLFNKEKMTLDGNKLILNYFYAEKNVDNSSNSVTLPEVKVVLHEEKAEVKMVAPKVPAVKVSVKRSNCDSSSEEDVIVVKKTKMNDGSEVVSKVDKTVTPKERSTEKKNLTPLSNKSDKKKINKPTFDKKQNNKPPFDKKQINKSPGDKKQISKQSPEGKKAFKKFPGNKKFNKKFQ